MNRDILNIQDLQTHFYTSTGIVEAVSEVNLKVGQGGNAEVVGLVGESGCGKTTVAFSIIRLVSPPGRIVGGKVLLNGTDLLQLTDAEMRSVRGNRVSMVFQDPMTYLNPVMKIGTQVGESIKKHRDMTNNDAKKIATELLEMTGIPSASEVANYYPFQLSGGMRQRVMIALALSCNPSLIIADEPTTSLDVTIQAQILDLMKKMINKFRSSVLLITHDLGIVADFCDRIYVMYAGRIIEHADVYTIFRNPAHPYTVALLKSVLSIDEFKEELVSIKGTVPSLINPPSGCRFHPRCPYCMPICHQEKPPVIEVEKGHTVSCWLLTRRGDF